MLKQLIFFKRYLDISTKFEKKTTEQYIIFEDLNALQKSIAKKELTVQVCAAHKLQYTIYTWSVRSAKCEPLQRHSSYSVNCCTFTPFVRSHTDCHIHFTVRTFKLIVIISDIVRLFFRFCASHGKHGWRIKFHFCSILISIFFAVFNNRCYSLVVLLLSLLNGAFFLFFF